MAIRNMLAQLANPQPAQPIPPINTLQKAAQPAPFQPSSMPWQQQIGNAIDPNSSGDAWNAIGRDGVINYIGDSLKKAYNTNNLSDFRWLEDSTIPGGYKLDWNGRQAPTGILGGIRHGALSTGLINGPGAGGASDGGPATAGNAADGLGFGATWEGEGGTSFAFYRKPDGSVGIRTVGQTSNDKGDIIAGLATLAGGYALGTGLSAAAGAGGAGAAGAAEGAAMAGAAEGAAGAGAAGAADIGMASFGQFGIPSAIPAGTGFGTLGTTALSAPVSTFGAGFGGGAIGSGLAGSLAAGAGGFGGGGATSTMGASGGAGTPPPANPYHPASYLDATNLKNLAGSSMSNFSWTDLIQPGMQLFSGYMNAKAAGDAGDDLLQASREAAERFEPWRQAGAWGIGRGATMLGKEGPEAARAAFAVDPGYQWRQEQGEKALTRNAAARGLMGSGKFLKDAMRFNQGEATQEFGNSFNRLMALAGMGQAATEKSTGYLTDGASAAAAGRIGQANAYTNALGQGMSMYNNNRLMRGLGY